MTPHKQKNERQERTLHLSDFVETQDNLAFLVQDIESRYVDELLKNLPRSEHKQFAGFQAGRLRNLKKDHPNRKHINNQLVRFAARNESRVRTLALNWLHSPENRELLDSVAEEVNAEQFRLDIMEVLAQVGVARHKSLLCALLLDERPEVRQLVTQELRGELLDHDSELVREAEKRWQELEQDREARRQLQDAQDEATQAHTQLEERDQQLEGLQARSQALEARSHETEKLLAQARSSQESAEHEREEQRLAAETAQTKQRETEEHSHQLEKQNAELQVQLQGFGVAQERVAELEAGLSTAQALKKSAEMRGRHLEKERDKLQLALGDERKHPHHTVSLAFLDESWRGALSSLAAHLRAHSLTNSQHDPALHPNGASPAVNAHSAPVKTTQRALDWRSWQQLENDSVRCLLDGSLFDSGSEPLAEDLEVCLSDTTRAQKLLALRWYLLEGFRRRVTESLQAANVVTRETEEQGETEPIRRSDSL